MTHGQMTGSDLRVGSRIPIRSPVLTCLLAAAILAGTVPPSGAEPSPGRAEATKGRAIFHGKGICFYCHGTDGDLHQRPSLSPDTESVIAGLTPPPADLRNPAALRDKTDTERFRTIREGHSGTGMLPDPTLSDQEIRDLLAYLAVLRGKGAPDTQPLP